MSAFFLPQSCAIQPYGSHTGFARMRALSALIAAAMISVLSCRRSGVSNDKRRLLVRGDCSSKLSRAGEWRNSREAGPNSMSISSKTPFDLTLQSSLLGCDCRDRNVLEIDRGCHRTSFKAVLLTRPERWLMISDRTTPCR